MKLNFQSDLANLLQLMLLHETFLFHRGNWLKTDYYSIHVNTVLPSTSSRSRDVTAPQASRKSIAYMMIHGWVVKQIVIQLVVGVIWMYLWGKLTVFRNVLIGIFFSSRLCLMHIKAVFISATCCQRVNLHFHFAQSGVFALCRYVLCSIVSQTISQTVLFLLQISKLFNFL